jgi:hypothetical protein
VALLILPCSLHAQEQEPAQATGSPNAGTSVAWGGFVDTYYAWDTNRPFTFDRAYTTQPARHAEFNVNLVFLEARLSASRVRGRAAVQWGTSVQANYAGEPKIGSTSGPDVSQFIQEASVGFQVSSSVWLDGGIFLSHLGPETWISRDNLTYTRSLVADFSPYYEAGVKLTWAVTPKLTAMFAVLNGWQNISAENTPPAGGVRVDWALNPKLTLSYDNFVGNAAADDAPTRTRFYQDAFAQYNPGRFKFLAVLSYGLQTKSTAEANTGTWWGGAAIARFQPSPKWAVVGRVEWYSDPHQIIVVTGVPDSFRATGASIGIDVSPVKPLLWRTEVRGFRSPSAVWPTHDESRRSSHDAVAVTSLALSF